jgi:hypothetical protein
MARMRMPSRIFAAFLDDQPQRCDNPSTLHNAARATEAAWRIKTACDSTIPCAEFSRYRLPRIIPAIDSVTSPSPAVVESSLDNPSPQCFSSITWKGTWIALVSRIDKSQLGHRDHCRSRLSLPFLTYIVRRKQISRQLPSAMEFLHWSRIIMFYNMLRLSPPKSPAIDMTRPWKLSR